MDPEDAATAPKDKPLDRPRITPKTATALIGKGMCLGVANVIPGVSGGTMALVLGIYERLIDALHRIGPGTVKAIFPPYPDGLLTKWQAEWKRIDFWFLVWLGVGGGVAILVCAKAIPYLMQNHHDATYGFFWGLILASIIIPAKLVKKYGGAQIAAIVLATAVTAGLGHGFASGNIAKAERKAAMKAEAQPTPAEQGIIAPPMPNGQSVPAPVASPDALDASPMRLAYLVLCGALSISAMILPGISGSFVLLLLGTYFDVMQAINTLRRLDFDIASVLVIAAFGTGAVIGILGFTRLLNWVFKKYHDTTVAALIGLMVGSLYGIWPFRHAVTVAGKRVDGLPKLPEVNENLIVAGVTCAIGIAVILAFAKYEKKHADVASDG